MELNLTNTTTVRDVKAQFTKYFPFLRVEFYSERHNKRESSRMKRKAADKQLLTEVSGILRIGSYLFMPTTTVADFEQTLQNHYGLPVQVFRKSADLWVETTQTDIMTLDQQNALGAASTKHEVFNLNTLFL